MSIFSEDLLVVFLDTRTPLEFISTRSPSHVFHLERPEASGAPHIQMEKLPSPPPPPPPPIAEAKLTKQLVYEPPNVQDESQQLLDKHGYLDEGKRQSDKRYMTCVVPCKSILQEGPTCGLVALLMAADAMKLNHSYDLIKLLDAAKERGFTQMGEMFSGKSCHSTSSRLSFLSFPSSFSLSLSLICLCKCVSHFISYSRPHFSCPNGSLK